MKENKPDGRAKIVKVGKIVNGEAVGWTFDGENSGIAGITIGPEILYGGWTVEELAEIAATPKSFEDTLDRVMKQYHQVPTKDDVRTVLAFTDLVHTKAAIIAAHKASLKAELEGLLPPPGATKNDKYYFYIGWRVFDRIEQLTEEK